MLACVVLGPCAYAQVYTADPMWALRSIVVTATEVHRPAYDKKVITGGALAQRIATTA